jgi:hypothetical protein
MDTVACIYRRRVIKLEMCDLSDVAGNVSQSQFFQTAQLPLSQLKFQKKTWSSLPTVHAGMAISKLA